MQQTDGHDLPSPDHAVLTTSKRFAGLMLLAFPLSSRTGSPLMCSAHPWSNQQRSRRTVSQRTVDMCLSCSKVGYNSPAAQTTALAP